MAGDNIDHALRGYADRVVNLHTERKTLNKDIAEVYAEAKGAGFDVTTLREMVRELQMEPDARNARYQLLDEYRVALGLLAGTPLGDYATEAAARVVPMPAKPFAEQPVHDPDRPRGRGRPRKTSSIDRAVDAARAHLTGGPQFDA